MNDMESRSVPNFPAYRVYPDGRIESKWQTASFYDGFRVEDRWREMRQNERPDGYRTVVLRDGYGGHRRAYVHVLVAEVFISPKPFARAVVRHLDGDATNNHASNIAWGTYKENEDDKRRHGTWFHRWQGKLDARQRAEIIRRAAGGESQRGLATEFAVSRPTITRLLNGSTWKVEL